jgi:lysozyme
VTPHVISPAGLEHLVAIEALRTEMYLDQARKPTIGIGHLLTPQELERGTILIADEPIPWRPGLTVDQCYALCDQDLDWAERAVNRLVVVDLTQGQFDALTSFVFNVGPPNFAGSTLRRRLNAGDYAAVPAQLRRWIFTGRPPIRSNGLRNRREAEVRLWEGG